MFVDSAPEEPPNVDGGLLVPDGLPKLNPGVPLSPLCIVSFAATLVPKLKPPTFGFDTVAGAFVPSRSPIFRFGTGSLCGVFFNSVGTGGVFVGFGVVPKEKDGFGPSLVGVDPLVGNLKAGDFVSDELIPKLNGFLAVLPPLVVSPIPNEKPTPPPLGSWAFVALGKVGCLPSILGGGEKPNPNFGFWAGDLDAASVLSLLRFSKPGLGVSHEAHSFALWLFCTRHTLHCQTSFLNICAPQDIFFSVVSLVFLVDGCSPSPLFALSGELSCCTLVAGLISAG